MGVLLLIPALIISLFPTAVEVLGFVLILAVVAVGVRYSLKTFRMVKKIDVENERRSIKIRTVISRHLSGCPVS